MKKLTEYEKGFLDGIIDADGCITVWMTNTNNPLPKEYITERESLYNEFFKR